MLQYPIIGTNASEIATSIEKGLRSGHLPTVETLWSSPLTIEHLRGAAKTYTTRREAMIAALKRYNIAAYGRSGLNVWVPEEVGVVTNLVAAGWAAVRGGERYRIKSPPAVRISIAALRPEEASKLAADFAQCLQPQRRTHSV